MFVHGDLIAWDRLSVCIVYKRQRACPRLGNHFLLHRKLTIVVHSDHKPDTSHSVHSPYNAQRPVLHCILHCSVHFVGHLVSSSQMWQTNLTRYLRQFMIRDSGSPRWRCASLVELRLENSIKNIRLNHSTSKWPVTEGGISFNRLVFMFTDKVIMLSHRLYWSA